MNLENKIIMILIVIILLLFTVGKAIGEKVDVQENLLKISAENKTYCDSNICSYQFTIENLDSVNRKFFISNIFYDNISILKLERYGIYEISEIINNPYNCNCFQDIDINGSLKNNCQVCDNYTVINKTYEGFYEIPTVKYQNKIKSSDKHTIMLNKFSENTFKVTINQDLGSKVKSDIETISEDNISTILDPWTDTESYFINLTPYKSVSFYNNISYGYHFTQGAEKVDSVSGNNMTNSTFKFSNDKNGLTNKAIELSNYYQTIPYNSKMPNTTRDFSMSMWIKFSATDTNKGLIARTALNSAYISGVQLSTTSNLIQLSAGSGGSTTTYGVISWYNHYVFNWYANKTVETYINGTKTQSYDATALQNAGTIPYVLGCYYTTAFCVTNTSVDELLIINKTLNTSEITELYNSYDNWGNFNNSIIMNKNDNLSINNSRSGVIVTYDSNLINQINDSALGNNLISGNCYTLLTNTLNWSINANINNSLDLSRAVNYTFVDCNVTAASGSSSILNLAYSNVKDSHLWASILNLLRNPSKSESYMLVQQEFDNLFYKMISVKKVHVQNKPVYYTTKDDLNKSFSELLNHATGTNFIIWFKKMIGYILTNINMQVVQ